MITPVYKNIEYQDEVFLERCLPNKGKILVTENENIYPYTKLGYSKNSVRELIIPKNMKLNSKLKNKKFIKSGDLLAYKENNYLFAPFDGYLEDRGEVKVLIKHQEDFWLLSGISGTVIKIVPSKSCLVKTSGFKFKFFATSISEAEGELKVLPNPSELIELHFLERYIKNGIGQIVYTGDYLRKSMLDKAIEIGCEGVICGSCDRETLLYAKQNNFFVGILSGFGRVPTPEKTFGLLKLLNNKYALILDSSSEMFLASDSKIIKGNLIKTPFTFLKNEMDVICLDYPYFGWEARVLKIEPDRISVKIKKNNEELSLAPSDLIALA